MVAKCTIFGRQSQGGFSESWYSINASTLSSAGSQALALAKLRLALMGLGAQIDGIRVSIAANPPEPKKSKLVDLSENGTGAAVALVADSTVTGYSDQVTRAPDVLQSALFVQCLAANGQRKFLYLACPPDTIMRANKTGPDYSTSGVWLQKYAAWKALVQGGTWGFRARDQGQVKQQITQWTTPGGAGTDLGAVVANGGPVLTLGESVQVQGISTPSRANRKALGTWTIGQILAGTPGAGFTTYVLTHSAGINSAVFIKLGTLQRVAYQILPITDVSILKEVSHKRGRFFGQFRGRQTRPARV